MLHLPRQVERFELIATTQKNAKTASAAFYHSFSLFYY